MTDEPSGAQLRGARAMLDWTLVDLSRAAHVSVSAIRRAETGDRLVPDDVVATLEHTFVAEGVRFLSDDGDGAGLRCLQKQGGDPHGSR